MPSVNKVKNDQETIREGRPEQMEKIEKTLQKTTKKEGSSSKPSDLIKELLPHGSSAKALGDREEMSSTANSLVGHSSPIRHANIEELIHEVKIETNDKKLKDLKIHQNSKIMILKLKKIVIAF